MHTNSGPNSGAMTDGSLDDHSRPSSLSSSGRLDYMPVQKLKSKKSFVASLFSRRSASRTEREHAATPVPGRF